MYRFNHLKIDKFTDLSLHSKWTFKSVNVGYLHIDTAYNRKFMKLKIFISLFFYIIIC